MSNSWLNDRVIVEWFEVVSNKRTQENYRREFPYFLEYVTQNTGYRTPTEIIESRMQQLRSQDMNERRFWETLGIKYMHSLEAKGYRKTTITTYLRTMLSFFSHAHVKLEYARKELLGAIEPNQAEKVQKDWIPSNEDVRLLYRMTQSARDRSILLTLYQSGFAPVDVCALNIENFDFYTETGEWKQQQNSDYYIAKLREKTNILTQTCISREALEDIRIMLQSRGYPTTGALFVSVHGQRLTPRDINNIIKSVVTLAFNGKAKLWKTKNLRDSYRNALVKARIPDDCIDAMFGHQRQGAKGSYNLSEDTIRAMYAEAFKFLTINGYGEQSKQISELNSQIQHLSTQNMALMKMLDSILTPEQKRQAILETAKTLPNMTFEKLRGIENNLKMFRHVDRMTAELQKHQTKQESK